MSKIKQINELNTCIMTYLDPIHREHYRVVNIRHNQVIIVASNGSAASQLRFQAPDLLKRLHHDPRLRKIQDIICKTSPGFHLTTPPPKLKSRRMQSLSAQSSQAIQEAAQSIQDEKLRGVMEKIARNKGE